MRVDSAFVEEVDGGFVVKIRQDDATFVRLNTAGKVQVLDCRRDAEQIADVVRHRGETDSQFWSPA